MEFLIACLVVCCTGLIVTTIGLQIRLGKVEEQVSRIHNQAAHDRGRIENNRQDVNGLLQREHERRKQ